MQGGRLERLHRGDIGRYGEIWGDMKRLVVPLAHQSQQLEHLEIYGDTGEIICEISARYRRDYMRDIGEI